MAKSTIKISRVYSNAPKKPRAIKVPTIKRQNNQIKFIQPKKFKRIVDNKMRAYGDTDLEKKVIRINKKKAKLKGRKGELLDSIMHEENHRIHPKMHEKNVRKLTKKNVNKMGKKQKQKLYNRFKGGDGVKKKIVKKSVKKKGLPQGLANWLKTHKRGSKKGSKPSGKGGKVKMPLTNMPMQGQMPMMKKKNKKLTYQARQNLPASAFVFPKTKGYPIEDINHARNALARSSGKPEEMAVKRAVYRRYPQLKK